jgi:hypothetical protein
MTLESVQQWLLDFRLQRTEIVALSSVKSLMNPERASIGEALRANGQRLWRLTSGLALRTAIREGRRGECKSGVCSMWRDPERFAAEPA